MIEKIAKTIGYIILSPILILAACFMAICLLWDGVVDNVREG